MWFAVCQRQRSLCCVFTGSWVSVTVSAPLSGPCGCRQRELAVADERKLHFKLRQLHASLAETRANKNVRELNHCSVFFCFPPWRVYVAFSFPVRPLPLTTLSQNSTPSVCAFATHRCSRLRASVCIAFRKRCGAREHPFRHSVTRRGRPGLPWQQKTLLNSLKAPTRGHVCAREPSSKFLIGWHRCQST